jgi:hypothetical protein
LLKQLWVDGYYSQVLTYVKLNKKTRGRIQSIRLVFAHYDRKGKRIGDVVQARALDSANAEWETYMVYTFPEDARRFITGFFLRIITKNGKGKK